MDETQTAPVITGPALIPGGRTVPAGQGVAWVGQGWKMFLQAPLMWVVNIVIFVVILTVISLVPFIGALASYALNGLLCGGLMLGAHKLYGGQPLEAVDVFSGFKGPIAKPLLIVGLFYMVAWLVIIITTAALFIVVLGVSGGIGAVMSGDSGALMGLMAGAGLGAIVVLLIVMALSIPIFMAFWFAPALVALGGMAPAKALGASFTACLKNFIPFLLYGLVFLVLFIIGLIPFGLGLLVVVPLLFTSTYFAYRDIFLGDSGAAAA